jgi:cytidylate kinase
MEGRDIGTIILPDADLKLFLFANENVRNQRRREDGESDLIEKRDLMDSTRTIAPLSEAENCVKIDTSKLTPSEVVTRISKLIDLL